MAAPITHIVLSYKVFDKYFQDKDKQEFLVGTSLPDIRYLGAIERDKSHYKNMTLKEISKYDSFDAGLRFHSLVDEIREKYMKNNNYYSLFPKSALLTQASKVFEDRVLYDKLNNWKEIVSYFNEIYQDELDLGISESDIEKWHKLLRNYFSHKPEDKNTVAFTLGMGFPIERAKEILRVIQNAETRKAEQFELEFYSNFESLLY
jgi:hypothetical protein